MFWIHSFIHKYEETPHDILQPNLNFSCQENFKLIDI